MSEHLKRVFAEKKEQVCPPIQALQRSHSSDNELMKYRMKREPAILRSPTRH